MDPDQTAPKRSSLISVHSVSFRGLKFEFIKHMAFSGKNAGRIMVGMV